MASEGVENRIMLGLKFWMSYASAFSCIQATMSGLTLPLFSVKSISLSASPGDAQPLLPDIDLQLAGHGRMLGLIRTNAILSIDIRSDRHMRSYAKGWRILGQRNRTHLVSDREVATLVPSNHVNDAHIHSIRPLQCWTLSMPCGAWS